MPALDPEPARRTLPAWARVPATAVLLTALAGCEAVVMQPHGDIARQQAQLILTATFLMLLIIVPVIALTLWFAWHYRQGNASATYRPDWDHSTRLELVIWGAPLLIIIALGAVTWISTHKLDPYRPLERLDAQRPLPPDRPPLRVQAVALDWKWLFLYPEQGIASLNELTVPVDRPIEFHITSSNVMNAFYVPAMAGMIYAMPGMQTELNAVINRAGDYIGLSSNYSGAGFSRMRFAFKGRSDAEFDAWVAEARRAPLRLDRATYLRLEQPSEAEPVRRFGQVEDGLWSAIVNRCVDRAKMCHHQMMAIDAAGGAGKAGVAGLTQSPSADGVSAWARPVVAALCTPADPFGRTTTARVADVLP